ncbi:MAG TPA: hypothetical protein DEA08_35410 [Planctomycetes bacterium]|nr:hypothetical protein [Planctomycetota bacterium]
MHTTRSAALWALLTLALAGPALASDPREEGRRKAATPSSGAAELYAELYARRLLMLQRLKAYADAGVFPQNTYRAGARSVFVDARGVRCAVGELLHLDGQAELVATIRRTNNFVRLQDVSAGPLVSWIRGSGLTKEECELIQPSYDHMRPRPRPEPPARLALPSQPAIQARLRATHRLLVQQTSAALEQATRRALQPHGVSGLALSFDVVRLREGRPALSPSPAPRLIWVRASYLAEGGALLARGRWLRARPDLAFCAAPEGAALALVEQAHQRPRPRLQPSQPTRRTSMGDFERHLNRTLHTIHVEDAEGTKVAALTISARIERVESWDHLEGGVDRPREPAGPHNRRIVEVPQGYAVYGHEWGGGLDLDASLPAGLDAIVARLKQDEGVRQGEALVGFTDPAFPEACAAWIAAETGTKATFVADRLGR